MKRCEKYISKGFCRKCGLSESIALQKQTCSYSEPEKTKSVQHYWISRFDGLIMSSEKRPPIKKPKLKYMGFTSDTTWPKKMNTGRILYKTVGKKKRSGLTKN